MLPEFDLVARHRPIRLIAAHSEQSFAAGTHPLPRPAPYAAAIVPVPAEPRATEREPSEPQTAPYDGARTEVSLHLGGHRFTAWVNPRSRRTGVDITPSAGEHREPQRIRSRRHGRIRRGSSVVELAITWTGQHIAVLTRSPEDTWTTRARVDLRLTTPGIDPHDPAVVSGLHVTGPDGLRAGGFGHLGLRDIRWVSARNGEPVREGNQLLLSATHAGPGFFDTGHTGIWAFDPRRHELTHRSDLFFHRPHTSDARRGELGVFGDHATHVLGEDDAWLVTTSTWSDFDLAAPRIEIVLARTGEDITAGEHVLSATPWRLPTTGLDSRGVWDPHLVHDGDRWLVTYVSAQEFFRFHPVLAAGPDLEHLALIGADTNRLECEGVTLVPPGLGKDWLLLASDGPKSRRGRRHRYPAFDLSVTQVGTLEAPHPSNIPWPSVVREGDGWLLVTFDGTPAGGPGAGYGTHGDVLVMRDRHREE